MVITQNGPNGLNAVQHVEEVHRYEQGIALALLHSTAGRTVVKWDQLIRHWNANKTPAVSSDELMSLKASQIFVYETEFNTYH